MFYRYFTTFREHVDTAIIDLFESFAMPKSDLHNPRRRSRSPRSRHVVHRRSRSPLSQRRHQPSSNGPESSATIRRDPLPFQAQPLGRSDLETYRPMFELYLDIQKQKVMENMPEQELKGRWKSFVGKWYAIHEYSQYVSPVKWATLLTYKESWRTSRGLVRPCYVTKSHRICS